MWIYQACLVKQYPTFYILHSHCIVNETSPEEINLSQFVNCKLWRRVTIRVQYIISLSTMSRLGADFLIKSAKIKIIAA